jgi:CheY-like chemotaxis protein
VPDEIYEDANRLRQVLINLLSNAVKFAAAGEVRVLVEPHRLVGGRGLRVAVRDRGPVIDPVGRARLFEPFSRLADGVDGAPLGTGLGLTICQQIVSLMGGEVGCSIWAIGDRDAGNEFWLTLPLKAVPGMSKEARPRATAERRRVLPRTRILLVEDILANQLVTATQLRREGHLVDIANNGAEAVAAVSSSPYDMVLMDMFLPGMSGLEATRHIRALSGPAGVAPIIALTANVSDEDKAMCLDAGMNGVLGKPAALPELLDAIARHVWPFRTDRLPLEAGVTDTFAAPASVLSASRLEELRTTLPADTLASLVEDCLVELAERLAILQDALRDQATDTIAAEAHAMAGMAAEYGLQVLEVRLRAIIRTVQDEPGEAAAIGEELEAEIITAATALRETLRIEMV